jgi:hypothetical protein
LTFKTDTKASAGYGGQSPLSFARRSFSEGGLSNFVRFPKAFFDNHSFSKGCSEGGLRFLKM